MDTLHESRSRSRPLGISLQFVLNWWTGRDLNPRPSGITGSSDPCEPDVLQPKTRTRALVYQAELPAHYYTKPVATPRPHLKTLENKGRIWKVLIHFRVSPRKTWARGSAWLRCRLGNAKEHTADKSASETVGSPVQIRPGPHTTLNTFIDIASLLETLPFCNLGSPTAHSLSLGSSMPE